MFLFRFFVRPPIDYFLEFSYEISVILFQFNIRFDEGNNEEDNDNDVIVGECDSDIEYNISRRRSTFFMAQNTTRPLFPSSQNNLCR